MRLALPTLLALSVVPGIAIGCWRDAAQRYGIAPQLLVAIAEAESSLNPDAVNRIHQGRTGSYDIGLMQINSAHLPYLARFGINEVALHDPCINIQVGAWLLSRQFKRHGVTWEAVGAYNAACTALRGPDCQRARGAYAWRVYRRLARQATPAAGIAAQVRLPNGKAVTAAVTTILSVKVSP
jgi:soluble lytic murein transglycosylase-like protein